VAGLIAGRRAARTLSPSARLMGTGVWNIVIYTINGFAFLLIGLQLPAIARQLTVYTGAELATWAVVISATVILARIVWVFPATYLPRILSAKVRARDPSPPPQAVFVIAWAGMRGAVSLAAALALPLDPKPFPDRDLVIFLTFCVIVATLVGQGLTLPYIVRRLGVMAVSGPNAEETRARLAATEAALGRLADLETQYPTHKPLIENLRSRYEHEASHSGPEGEGPRDEEELELLEHKEIRDAVLEAQRDAVIALRDDGIIGDEILADIQRDLDLEALRSGA
jgi:NhaP-type Na+/H+ or K+/H+ antiporter